MRTVLPLVALALVVSACAGSVSDSPPSDQAVAAAEKLTTVQRFHAARPVAVDYVKALARGDRSAAQADVGNSDYNQLNSLSVFETWFSLIPAKRLHVRAVPLKVHDQSSVGVRMVLTARLGPAPLTPWVKLGERVLLGAGSAHRMAGAGRHHAPVERARAPVRPLADGAAALSLGAPHLGGVRARRRPAGRPHDLSVGWIGGQDAALQVRRRSRLPAPAALPGRRSHAG